VTHSGAIGPKPDQKWYSEVGAARGVQGRCPYATIETCPRFFQSLSLLGEVGSTRIPKEEDDRLLAAWKKSDLWPRTEEQGTGVWGGGSSFSNFCPEVTFDRFGYFATSLSRYSDEIDSGSAHERLAAQGAPAGHPLWSWQHATAQHFTDCPIHSVLNARPHTLVSTPMAAEPPWWREHLWKLITAGVVAIIGILAKLLTG
jgi:hypothetical protein